jgi:hypothetical protein
MVIALGYHRVNADADSEKGGEPKGRWIGKQKKWQGQ